NSAWALPSPLPISAGSATTSWLATSATVASIPSIQQAVPSAANSKAKVAVPITINGLWGLAFGNGALAGATNMCPAAAGERTASFARTDVHPTRCALPDGIRGDIRINAVLEFIDRGPESMPSYPAISSATPALWKPQSKGSSCSLPLAEGVRHLDEQRLQLLEPPGAHSPGELLIEVAEDVGTNVGLVPPTLGEAHQRCAPVPGIGTSFYVAVLLQVIHQVPDRLVGELGSLRQLPDARSLGPQVLEDRHVGGLWGLWRSPRSRSATGGTEVLLVNSKRGNWWAVRGSNSRPPRCKRGALAI